MPLKSEKKEEREWESNERGGLYNNNMRLHPAEPVTIFLIFPKIKNGK